MQVKNVVLSDTSVDCGELWVEWLDWAFAKEMVMISKNIYNKWVLRIIIEDKYWKKLKNWFSDHLYIENDSTDPFDKQFFRLKEKELTRKDQLIVFKGTEKVYSILRYTYALDPQRDFSWIDNFLLINTEMKEKFLV